MCDGQQKAGWGVRQHAQLGLQASEAEWLRQREKENRRADIVAAVLVGLALALLAAAFV